MPINLLVHDIVVVFIGMPTNFPSLARFVSSSPEWAQLEVLMKAFGLDPELPVPREELMGIFDGMEVRAAENPEALASSGLSCESLSSFR